MRSGQPAGGDETSFAERWAAESVDITPLTDADRQRVIEGIRQVYRYRRVPWPDHVIWLRSPFDHEGRLVNPLALAEQHLQGPGGQAAVRHERRQRVTTVALNFLREVDRLGLIFPAYFAVLRPKIAAPLVLTGAVAGVAYSQVSGSGAAGQVILPALFGVGSLFLVSLFMVSAAVVQDGVKEFAKDGPFSAVELLEPISVQLMGGADWQFSGNVPRPSSDIGLGTAITTINRSVARALDSLWEDFWQAHQDATIVGLDALGSTNSAPQEPIFSCPRSEFHLPGRIWALESGRLTLRPQHRDLHEGLNATRRAVGWAGYRTIVVICEPPIELHTEQVASHYRLHNARGPAVVWASSPIGTCISTAVLRCRAGSVHRT